MMRLRDAVLKKHRLPKYLWLLHTLKKLIKNHSFSVADPGCLSRIPDPAFLVIPDPGSGSRILNKKERCKINLA
jgi:hypothetical protein